MMSRNSPNVMIVIGNVRITKIGFTINRSKAMTMATIIAEPYPSTKTPGKTFDKITTARAVKSTLIIFFMVNLILNKDKELIRIRHIIPLGKQNP